MKKYLMAAVYITLAILFYSCNKNGVTPTTGLQNARQKQIYSPGPITLSSLSGITFSAVTITGSNFNITPGATVVNFNGVPGIINSITTTQIVVTVPGGASTGKITVTTDGGTVSSASDFKVLHLAEDACFNTNTMITSMAFDKTGNGNIYASDNKNIYKMSSNGSATVIFTTPPFAFPFSYILDGIVTAPDGNIYAAVTKFKTVIMNGLPFTNQYNSYINKVTPNGQSSKVLGQDVDLSVANSHYTDGDASTATFRDMAQVINDDFGNDIYTIDFDNNNRTLREITRNGTASTLNTSNFFSNAFITLGCDRNGNVYIVANNQLKKMNPNGNVTVIAGTQNVSGVADGPGAQAQFGDFHGSITIDANDNILIAETPVFFNPFTSVRIVNTAGYVSTFARGLLTPTDKLFIDRVSGKLYIVSGKIITRYTFG